MRKRITAYALLSLVLVFILTSCKQKRKIVDVSIKEGYLDTIEVGSFDVSNYSIIETYNDDTKEEVPMTLDMISDYERTKLYQIGSHDIIVVYLNTEIEFHLTITRAKFRCRLFSEDENIVYLGTEEKKDTFGNTLSVESYQIVYDGKSHAFDIEGYYPKSTLVDYPSGNSFKNVGTYDCKAVLNADGYETKILYASLNILSASYDMSELTLPEMDNLVYDDTQYTFAVDEDKLPEGVTVSYTINQSSGNTAKDAGEYTVIATFTSNDLNYDKIPAISKTYTIKKATYSTEEFVVGYIPDMTKVAAQNVKYTGSPVQFTIITPMPSWLTAKYINYIAKDDTDRVIYYENECYVKNSTGDYKKNEDGSFSKTEYGGSYLKVDAKEYVCVMGTKYVSLDSPYYIKVNDQNINEGKDSFVNYYVKIANSEEYVLKKDLVFYTKNSRGEYIKSETGNYILLEDGTYQPKADGIYYLSGETYVLAEDTEMYVHYGDMIEGYTSTQQSYEYASISSKHYIKASLDYFEVKEIGTYTMEIEFRVDNDNYNEVSNMEFEISIYEGK